MKLRIGYACITLALLPTRMRTAHLTRYLKGQVNLPPIYQHNLDYAVRSVRSAARRGMKAYRLSSDLFPLLDYDPATLLPLVPPLEPLDEAIHRNDVHLSMHPGQFILLGSPRDDVTINAVRHLEVWAKLLDFIGATGSLTLHGGGVHGDRVSAAVRLRRDYEALDPAIQARVAFENDERLWTTEELHDATGGTVPLVFDRLHWEANPRRGPLGEEMGLARETWPPDRVVEVHYSEQDPQLRTGAHARGITGSRLVEFVQELAGIFEDREVALIVEAKEKDWAIERAWLAMSEDERDRLREVGVDLRPAGPPPLD